MCEYPYDEMYIFVDIIINYMICMTFLVSGDTSRWNFSCILHWASILGGNCKRQSDFDLFQFNWMPLFEFCCLRYGFCCCAGTFIVNSSIFCAVQRQKVCYIRAWHPLLYTIRNSMRVLWHFPAILRMVHRILKGVWLRSNLKLFIFLNCCKN